MDNFEIGNAWSLTSSRFHSTLGFNPKSLVQSKEEYGDIDGRSWGWSSALSIWVCKHSTGVIYGPWYMAKDVGQKLYNWDNWVNRVGRRLCLREL